MGACRTGLVLDHLEAVGVHTRACSGRARAGGCSGSSRSSGSGGRGSSPAIVTFAGPQTTEASRVTGLATLIAGPVWVLTIAAATLGTVASDMTFFATLVAGATSALGGALTRLMPFLATGEASTAVATLGGAVATLVTGLTAAVASAAARLGRTVTRDVTGLAARVTTSSRLRRTVAGKVAFFATAEAGGAAATTTGTRAPTLVPVTRRCVGVELGVIVKHTLTMGIHLPVGLEDGLELRVALVDMVGVVVADVRSAARP